MKIVYEQETVLTEREKKRLVLYPAGAYDGEDYEGGQGGKGEEDTEDEDEEDKDEDEEDGQ